MVGVFVAGVPCDSAAIAFGSANELTVRQLRQILYTHCTHVSAPRVVGHALLGTHANRLLIGACNPLTCLIHGAHSGDHPGGDRDRGSDRHHKDGWGWRV